MPSKVNPDGTSPQHDLMEAVAHNIQFAKKKGIPQSVGKDYVAADQAKGIGRKK